jgi:hypothetical protein
MFIGTAMRLPLTSLEQPSATSSQPPPRLPISS